MRYFILGLLLAISSPLLAQEEQVEMADGFYSEGKIYVVVAVAALVFIGIALYLYILDRKVSKLEQKVGLKKEDNKTIDS